MESGAAEDQRSCWMGVFYRALDQPNKNRVRVEDTQGRPDLTCILKKKKRITGCCVSHRLEQAGGNEQTCWEPALNNPDKRVMVHQAGMGSGSFSGGDGEKWLEGVQKLQLEVQCYSWRDLQLQQREAGPLGFWTMKARQDFFLSLFPACLALPQALGIHQEQSKQNTQPPWGNKTK